MSELNNKGGLMVRCQCEKVLEHLMGLSFAPLGKIISEHCCFANSAHFLYTTVLKFGVSEIYLFIYLILYKYFFKIKKTLLLFSRNAFN